MIYEALDLNSNGQLGLPDLLGWAFFATVGLLGVAVLIGMALAAMLGLTRGARAVARGSSGSAQRVGALARRRHTRGMRTSG
jgi:hypothetical protein